jgi:hypothetical protein
MARPERFQGGPIAAQHPQKVPFQSANAPPQVPSRASMRRSPWATHLLCQCTRRWGAAQAVGPWLHTAEDASRLSAQF